MYFCRLIVELSVLPVEASRIEEALLIIGDGKYQYLYSWGRIVLQSPDCNRARATTARKLSHAEGLSFLQRVYSGTCYRVSNNATLIREKWGTAFLESVHDIFGIST